MKIESADSKDYLELIKVWEASVRATHDFLPEEEIEVLKPVILENYFDAVDLTCIKDSKGNIQKFCGVHDGNIEMLFISPAAMGSGIGRLLTKNAIENQGATKVDVNEQNDRAFDFYRQLGFKVIGRSPLDGQGKPYPILQMALSTI